MNVIGIIAEYNPFHNGHKYQIETIRRQTNADYIIVAMSGDFLQRGTPAITDKHTRAGWALSNGADLVLELPACWATASAEYFATAGVHLLAQTGVVTSLCYGMEDTNLTLKSDIVKALCHAPNSLHEQIRSEQKRGVNYPVARAKALHSLLPQYTLTEIQNYLCAPNNILGIEYEKAISQLSYAQLPSMTSHPLMRKGDGYHDSAIQSEFASATALRAAITENTDSDSLSSYMPENALSELLQHKAHNQLLSVDDFSAALYDRLLFYKDLGYSHFADCDQDLSDKITNHLHDYCGFSYFTSLLKSKDMTYTRIQRVLTHILLNISQSDYEHGRLQQYNSYLRILGFRKEATPLLSQIKKQASLPMITKVADARLLLSDDAYTCLQKDIYAADLYRGIAQIKTGHVLRNEYTREILRV